MFYKKEDVNEAITCGICAQIYIDPRILPCGEFACNECIQSASNTVNEFDCNFCKEKHTPTGESGFVVNKQLLKLLKAPADAVFRNTRVEELKIKLDEVKTKCDSFKFYLDNESDKINEHCNQLRNQVDLQTELVIQKAQKFNESLRSDIGKYEKDTIETFKQTKLERHKDANTFIAEIQEFHAYTSKYLSEFKIDENVIDNSLTTAVEIIQNLKYKDMWSMVDIKMEFIRNEGLFDKTVIGCLANEKTGLSRFKFDKIDLSIIHDYQSHLNLIALGNGKYEAFYINKDSILSYITFGISHESKPLNNISRPLCNAKIVKLNVVKIDYSFILVFSLMQPNQSFCFCNQQFSANKKHHCTMKITSHFCNNKYFPNEHAIDFMVASKSCLLFVESDKIQFPRCLLFSSRLEKLKTLLLEDILTSDEIIVDVKINEASILFLCNTNELMIFDLAKLATVKVIQTRADQIQLVFSKFTSSSMIVLFDSANKIIEHYDQCGDFQKLGTYSMQKFDSSGLKLMCEDSKTYSLYNPNNLTKS
jgi:hypothetical protein